MSKSYAFIHSSNYFAVKLVCKILNEVKGFKKSNNVYVYTENYVIINYIITLHVTQIKK